MSPNGLVSNEYRLRGGFLAVASSRELALERADFFFF